MGVNYVDNTLHSAQNATGVATGGGSNCILLQNSGIQDDGAFNGYGILITSGTGAGQQRRILDFDFTGHPSGERCASVTENWATVPDSTSGYEITVGSDANSGANPGVGATGAWRTINKAVNAMSGAGTGTETIYVKAARHYLETVTIGAARTSGNPVIVEGYLDTPGDGGQATIDGASTRNYGITASVAASLNYAFRNMLVVNCASNGFELSNASTVRLLNCRADNNGGTGFNTGADMILVGCQAVGNASNGFVCPLASSGFANLLFHCRARGNVNQQFRGGCMLMIFCSASQLSDGKRAVSTSVAMDGAYLVNCTIDGTGSVGATGFYTPSGGRFIIVNSVFSNLERGIHANSTDNLRLGLNNLFHNCSAGTLVSYPSQGGDILGDPLFVDAPSGNLQVAVGSPALRAGYPPYVDVGSNQHNSRTPVGGPCRRGMQA